MLCCLSLPRGSGQPCWCRSVAARIEYPAADDPMQQESTALAMAIGTVILSNTDSVNVAITALSRALSGVLSYVNDKDFEPALSSLCECVRINRAVMVAPPLSEMN